MGNETEASSRGEYHPTIKEMPSDMRPRERLVQAGEGALSSAELLAIILRTGMGGENVLAMATRLLTSHGGLAGLARASFAELVDVRGLGPAKVAQIKAAFELGRRMLLEAPDERPAVRSPYDVAELLRARLGHLPQENFCVVYLDTRNHVLDVEVLYKGSLNASHIRVAEVFREAVKRNCAAIIVGHNHPSGDPSPSSEDVTVTERLVAAGKLLGIELLDHLVVAQRGFVSLREREMGFDPG